jgi:hypothetical protein
MLQSAYNGTYSRQGNMLLALGRAPRASEGFSKNGRAGCPRNCADRLGRLESRPFHGIPIPDPATWLLPAVALFNLACCFQ